MSHAGVGGTSRIVKFVLSTFLASWAVIADYEKADAFVRSQQAVPWVLVRPAHLTDGARTDKYTTSFKGWYHIAMKISRADVASFLLLAVSSPKYENKAV